MGAASRTSPGLSPASRRQGDERLQAAKEPWDRSDHASFVETEPTVQYANDRRKLVLETRRPHPSLSAQPGVLQRLEHPKRLVKGKEHAGWNRCQRITIEASAVLMALSLVNKVRWIAAVSGNPACGVRQHSPPVRHSGASEPASPTVAVVVSLRTLPDLSDDSPGGTRHRATGFGRKVCSRAGNLCFVLRSGARHRAPIGSHRGTSRRAFAGDPRNSSLQWLSQRLRL